MIFTKKFPKSITAECYRNIRTSLEYSSIDRKLRTIVITSSEAGEGKSTVASNLAYILSQGGKRIILIDCDLRKPSLHRKFGESNEKGLTGYLIGKYSLDDAVKEIDDNLHLLTSGNIPPNPAEVIASRGMEELIEELKYHYEHIILDTPPVRAVTDGQILAGKSDGTVLVVMAEKTKSDSIMQGYKELEKVRARVLGTIINGASTDRREAYYYDYSTNSRRKKKNK
ncbi:CpsD/CapB family tyrosine-protein kinase [Clostridium sardiniense]|uniref:CpsD/CapB family tyrosine-protein kinase n=1 Tax=Clostridium sardiniense TaxID=29369 RepID=UPI003D34FBB2